MQAVLAANDVERCFSEARNKGVFEPVDRIYGLLSLASEEIRSSIPVDYRPEAVRNYRNLYRIATRTNRRLPSWCPDYNVPSMANNAVLPFGTAGFFTKRTRTIFEAGTDDNRIRVGGHIVDKVKNVSENFDWQWSPQPDLNTSPHGYAAKIIKWMDSVEEIMCQYLRDDSQLTATFWQCVLAYVPPTSSGEKMTTHNFPPEPERGLKAIRTRFRELSENVSSEASGLDPAEWRLMQPVMTYLPLIWRNRVFFVSEEGRFGIASRGIRSDDEISLFVGEPHFYALRRGKEKTHSFRSVVYLHDQMRGEMLRQLPEGSHEMLTIY